MYKWFDELTRLNKPNREKSDYHHYGLYEVEILNNIFNLHDVKSVLSLGGMSNLDFFLAQFDNKVETATNIDEAVNWRGYNLEDKQQEYIKKFGFNGEYIFTRRSLTSYDVVDKKYNVVFCNIDTLKGDMKVIPDIFIKMWSRIGLVEDTREKMTLEYERFFSNVVVTTNMTVFSNKDIQYETNFVETTTKLERNRKLVYQIGNFPL
jgi:hypothetical protein